MVKKAEDARQRFGSAAFALFRERGYAQTTVPEIAAATGLTDRTFYRYFPDKAEVLFLRAGEFEVEIAQAICAAPEGEPLSIVIGALEAAGKFFDDNREDVRTRQSIVMAQAHLLERELSKMQALVMQVKSALHARGVPGEAARVIAETGILVWRIAIDRWTESDEGHLFPHHVRGTLTELQAMFGK